MANKLRVSKSGSGAPTAITPDFLGQIYIDEDTGTRYEATALTEGSWVDKLSLKEDTANKKTDLSGNSDTYYPTQKAVKTAVDAKQDALGFTPENVANKKTTITSSDTDYPTCKAVETGLAAKQASLGYTAEDAANKVTSFQGNPDDTHYPSEKLVKDSLDAKQDTLNINSLTEKTTPVDDDVLLIEDSEASYAKKKVKKSALGGGSVSFGGTGVDGALNISSGTTTIDLGGVAIFIKNYSSISITGTGKLAFSNPHSRGTIIILKSQGDVKITSSTNPAIDLRNLGAYGGSAGADGGAGNGLLVAPKKGNGSLVAGSGALAGFGVGIIAPSFATKWIPLPLFTGSGGGGGRNDTYVCGGGGRGAGCLMIECGGALNISSTINASGTAGGDYVPGSGNSNGAGGGGGPSLNDTPATTWGFMGASGAGGGGGGGGVIVILYNTLTSNTGTFIVTGGAGGSIYGGAGSVGYSLVAKNPGY